eukprot:CAMPEP_0119324872 /NCGR_PEP_ID=MMETSP1333-20130426/64398_1 /TAXON_ID=418940 /ORGANISM="Scyphosphaera apsteinii, Strain RCC1455" /LENGTH=57 /DNA_ID=CAMNT_0007332687 /DNA_START=244 /DNA_END=417 /DNA_ORIENTATION=+
MWVKKGTTERTEEDNPTYKIALKGALRATPTFRSKGAETETVGDATRSIKLQQKEKA